MTKSQLDLIRRALELLHRLVPDDEPRADDPTTRRCPALTFVKRYLCKNITGDQSSDELWRFFGEVVAARELEALSKSEFLRRIPTALEVTFGVKKSHNIERGGHRVRGFKGIEVREHALAPSVLELEPE